MKSTFQKLRNIKSIPQPYGNLLGYQSINVIDPQFSEFARNFVIDDYYLTIYGTKYKDQIFQVQYNKKYADGRTTYYTEILNLTQINELLSILENLDRLSENNLSAISHINQNYIDHIESQDAENIENVAKDAKVHYPTKYFDNP